MSHIRLRWFADIVQHNARDAEIRTRVFRRFLPRQFVVRSVTTQGTELIGKLRVIEHRHQLSVRLQAVSIGRRRECDPLQFAGRQRSIVLVVELAIIRDQPQRAAPLAKHLEADLLLS